MPIRSPFLIVKLKFLSIFLESGWYEKVTADNFISFLNKNNFLKLFYLFSGWSKSLIKSKTELILVVILTQAA